KRFKSPLGKVLVTLGFVTEATIRDILSETLGQVSIDLENTIVDPAAIALVPKDMARRYHVLPVSYDADKKLLLIAVSDPANAVKRSASDIHFEPEQGFLRIRYRIDGVLRQIRSLHKNYWAAMVVRLKVMSGMNIAETRAPQDGRISLTLSGHQVDFRVSSQP